jgi:hypothetical protein
MIRFTNASYESSHGRAPRGRGSWAFCPAFKADHGDYLDFTIFSPAGMTISEAKTWAKAKIAELCSTATDSSPFASIVWTVMP